MTPHRLPRRSPQGEVAGLSPEALHDLRLFIFDLDGTLIDSKLDLALAVNATRDHLRLPPLPHEQIYGYVGHGAAMLIRRSLGAEYDAAAVEAALRFFLDYYRAHMLDNTVAYPGVRAALAELAANARILTVLTNKPARFSTEILQGLGLASYFRSIYGGNSFERKKPDPMGVEVILRESRTATRQTILVGDSEIDVLTGRNAGTWTCGVTYGLGSDRLADPPPDLLVDSLTQLSALTCPEP
ncbi:MAG: HAD family hydrolase [Terriglobia bacterium]